MGTENMETFTLCEKETDLWIAVDAASYYKELEVEIASYAAALRKELDEYISGDIDFAETFEPYRVCSEAPGIAKRMSEASIEAGVGPMAAVAGAFSRFVGEKIEEKTNCSKLIVENGGDIYLTSHEIITMGVFAGQSPFNERIGIKLEPGGRIGICTSSGTVGHSHSFGKADALVVMCRDVILADAFATSLANLVNEKKDISAILEESEKYEQILGVLVILEDEIGAWGRISMELVDLKGE